MNIQRTSDSVQTITQHLSLAETLLAARQVIVRQKKSWWQIITDFEARNKYELYDPQGTQIGWIVETKGGFFNLIKRLVLKSHRPFLCAVIDMNGKEFLKFGRKFFWFFSDIYVTTPEGVSLGSAHRRFAFLHKVYDLRDRGGIDFARINSGFFRIWTFRIFNLAGFEKAVISKKWGGAMKEIFTDADTFSIEFGVHPWKAHERAVILAVALSIDFDFFERNGKSGGLLNIFGD